MANKFLTFNGSTGYVTVSDNAALNFGTGDFSVSFWMNWNRDGFGDVFYFTFFDKYNFPSGGWDFYIGGSVEPAIFDKVVFFASDATDYVSASTPSKVTENTWNHIVLVYDSVAGLATVYLNTQAGTPADCSAVDNLTNTDDLTIGGSPVDNEWYQGSLDDIRIYKKTLTTTEINTIYNEGLGKKYSADDAGPAAAVWNIDEGTGTTITDEINSLTGAFTGGVSWHSGGVPLLDYQILSVPVFGNPFHQSLQSEDVSGVEEILAAESGKTHYLTKLLIHVDAAMDVSIGSGESGEMAQIQLGPIPLSSSRGKYHWQAPNNRGLKCTAESAFVIDSSGAGTVWIEAHGKTCRNIL